MRVALVMKHSVPEKQLDKFMPAGTDSPSQMQGHPSPPRASGRPHGHRHPMGSGSQGIAVLLPWGDLTKRAGWAPEVCPSSRSTRRRLHVLPFAFLYLTVTK